MAPRKQAPTQLNDVRLMQNNQVIATAKSLDLKTNRFDDVRVSRGSLQFIDHHAVYVHATELTEPLHGVVSVAREPWKTEEFLRFAPDTRRH